MSNSGAIPLILVKKEQLVEGKYKFSLFFFFLVEGRLLKPILVYLREETVTSSLRFIFKKRLSFLFSLNGNEISCDR